MKTVIFNGDPIYDSWPCSISLFDRKLSGCDLVRVGDVCHGELVMRRCSVVQRSRRTYPTRAGTRTAILRGPSSLTPRVNRQKSNGNASPQPASPCDRACHDAGTGSDVGRCPAGSVARRHPYISGGGGDCRTACVPARFVRAGDPDDGRRWRRLRTHGTGASVLECRGLRRPECGRGLASVRPVPALVVHHDGNPGHSPGSPLWRPSEVEPKRLTAGDQLFQPWRP